MPVSSGLQKYFDSQKKKKGDIKKTLDSLKGQIDPAFLQSFESFNERILWIVEDNPEVEDIVEEELWSLSEEFSKRKRVHNMKKAAAMIESAERA